ncbi:MAG: hypothetical protein H7Y04_11355 [Verrucomicrobia bacterium]|nr:hypothetical protein [Cytophagales bacterium]
MAEQKTILRVFKLISLLMQTPARAGTGKKSRSYYQNTVSLFIGRTMIFSES